jgi:hypothetical protein
MGAEITFIAALSQSKAASNTRRGDIPLGKRIIAAFDAHLEEKN